MINIRLFIISISWRRNINPEFKDKGATSGLTVSMKNTLYETVKVVVMDNILFVLEGLILMFDKGVLGLVRIKKRRYWHNGVPADENIWHTQNEEVGDVDMVQG